MRARTPFPDFIRGCYEQPVKMLFTDKGMNRTSVTAMAGHGSGKLVTKVT